MSVFPIRLDPWTDAIGLLHELQNRDGCLVAKIGPVVVALPSELEERLKGLVGQRIGILRAEGSDYRLKISGRAHA